MRSNSFVFHNSGRILSSAAAFLLLIFLSTKSSSCVNCPTLMSTWLQIIFVIGSSVAFGIVSNKFSKCCFYTCIRSSSLAAFSLVLAVIFLLLILFAVCHAMLDCLSLTESLILLIWFSMYSVCSFRYMLVNSFCAFLSFWALILVEVHLLHWEAIFTSACFFLTANVSYWTLGLILWYAFCCCF